MSILHPHTWGLERLLALLMAIFSVFWPMDSATRGANGSPNVIDEFDVDSGGQALLLLPVSVAGREYEFALDTGASHDSYDVTLRDLLGRAVSRSDLGTLHGPVAVDLYRAPAASVGQIRLGKINVTCLDLSGLRKYGDRDVRGLIGIATLRHHIVQIDFAAGKVRFLRSLEEDVGRPVPLLIEDGVPCVRAQLGDGEVHKFGVDTGALSWSASGHISSGTFDELLRNKNMTFVDKSLSFSAAGVHGFRKARLNGFDLAGFAHDSLIFGEAARSVLGLRYLARYAVTFDFPRSTMYLRAGKDFNRWDDDLVVGLVVVRRGSQLIVEQVDPGSLAADWALAVGDVVEGLEGREGEKLTWTALRRAVTERGRRGTLTVRRDGVALRIPFAVPPIAADKGRDGPRRTKEPGRKKAGQQNGAGKGPEKERKTERGQKSCHVGTSELSETVDSHRPPNRCSPTPTNWATCAHTSAMRSSIVPPRLARRRAARSIASTMAGDS